MLLFLNFLFHFQNRFDKQGQVPVENDYSYEGGQFQENFYTGTHWILKRGSVYGNVGTLASLVWDHCDQTVRDRIQGTTLANFFFFKCMLEKM